MTKNEGEAEADLRPEVEVVVVLRIPLEAARGVVVQVAVEATPRQVIVAEKDVEASLRLLLVVAVPATARGLLHIVGIPEDGVHRVLRVAVVLVPFANGLVIIEAGLDRMKAKKTEENLLEVVVGHVLCPPVAAEVVPRRPGTLIERDGEEVPLLHPTVDPQEVLLNKLIDASFSVSGFIPCCLDSWDWSTVVRRLQFLYDVIRSGSGPDGWFGSLFSLGARSSFSF